MYVSIYLVLAACAVAIVTDVRYRKIPNYLTGSLALAAVVLAAVHGFVPFLIAIAILVGMIALGFLAFSMDWLGGGDVKLLAASAAALSVHDVMAFLLYTSLSGGVLAVLYALVKGRLPEVMHSVALVVRPLFYRGTVSVVPKQPIKLPYGVAIAAGATIVALSDTVAPFLRLPL